MKWIKLRKTNHTDVWVDVTCITAMEPVNVETPYTVVWLAGFIDGFTVGQTPEQIMEMAKGQPE